ncbi:acyltransferase family protein [Alteromonas gracilis]|uniref:Acyltransferase n=1 Tax=Alteromonas gracilis TaxID=1479524 RepID=A0ABX5CPG3_9ALTE|nr:acyltransferase family protein [Alteromonas gracilis]PRO68742.1 acyltransferase [Alteromonas gracilis]
MTFRHDINGIRALAVLSVVIFHFLPSWLPGGFVGVDVFFVISGYLMTAIIVTKLTSNNFNIWDFYLARANRIIPSLLVLCLVLLLLGFFLLTPVEYGKLAKQTLASSLFISNLVYYKESGYFAEDSLENWLLHTWSLSVEWQFYLIYPIAMIVVSKLLARKLIPFILTIGTVSSLALSIWLSPKNPELSYFALPTRAWEMLAGGLLFFWGFKTQSRATKILEYLGVTFIVLSCIVFSEDIIWPGYAAILPVLGTCLIIAANQNDSSILNKLLFQKLGAWSYSIYLWHWPLVVLIYTAQLGPLFIPPGLILTLILGYASYNYVERLKLIDRNSTLISCFKNIPLQSALIIAAFSFFVFSTNGIISRASMEYQTAVNDIKASPLRAQCHTNKYMPPKDACEYFVNKNVKWATLADSHSVEIAYALAKDVSKRGEGVKHFSFSGCKPSYGMNNDFSPCARWYNDVVDYLIADKTIENVVFLHRYSSQIVGGSNHSYPALPLSKIGIRGEQILENIDRVILALAKHKKNVIVLYPVPELPDKISKLIDTNYTQSLSFENLKGTETNWFLKRNEVIISHFDNAEYPDNVVFVKPHKHFCDKELCYAVKDGRAVYFDDDHLSVYGASGLVNEIISPE